MFFPGANTYRDNLDTAVFLDVESLRWWFWGGKKLDLIFRRLCTRNSWSHIDFP